MATPNDNPNRTSNAAPAFQALPDPDALGSAFPFHLVIDPALTLLRVGAGLERIDDGLRAGSALTGHFTLLHPEAPLSWDLLVESAAVTFRLLHRRTGLELQGRMVITGPEGPAVFLGSSWLTDPTQLAEFGYSAPTAWRPATDSESERPRQESTEDRRRASDTATTDLHTARAQRDRAERGLALQMTVTRCLAEATGVDDALRRIVDALPDALGWASATLWSTGSGGPLTAAHHCPPHATPPPPDDTLALRALTSGAPSWQSGDGTGGFALPAHSGALAAGVITCYSDRAEPEDAELLRELALVSAQIAQFVARQRDTERLHRLTCELAAIFQLSPDGFVTFNEFGIRSYVNPAFMRMTGITRDELEDVDEAQFEARLALLLDRERPPQTGADGSEVIHLLLPRPTVIQRSWREARDLDGRLFGRILYFRDITLESELVRSNNEFLANAAHELRTPLTSIQGFAELLLRRDIDADRRRQVLETIHGQTVRLAGIVNELLDVARFDARATRDAALVPQPLTPVVEQAVAQLLVRNDPRRPLIDLPPLALSPYVRIDRDRITQALTNLLSNAYKYSPQGGDITVTLRHRQLGEEAWVGIAVRDHGIGMSDSERKRMFERFYRAQPAGPIPGTGLGMSMVKKIMDVHGGDTEVVSAPGQGTEVTLWLPLAATDKR